MAQIVPTRRRIDRDDNVPPVRRPTLTVGLPNYGPGAGALGWRALLDLARTADGAGIDRIVVVDHVVMSRHTDAYAWGPFPFPPEAPWLEPLTTLGAFAAVTERVRLATGILVAPLRSAVLLAKTAATIDALSGGRLDLGVGTGWQREEYDASGIDFATRGQRLTDTIAACKTLWRDAPATFSSPTVSFTEIWCEPRPAQPGGVPIWVAGTLHDRAVSRIVEHGDGWIPIMGASRAEIVAGGQRLREAFVGRGRDPATLEVQAPLPPVRGDDGGADVDRMVAAVPELAAAGVTNVQIALRALAADPQDAAARLERLARRFAAEIP